MAPKLQYLTHLDESSRHHFLPSSSCCQVAWAGSILTSFDVLSTSYVLPYLDPDLFCACRGERSRALGLSSGEPLGNSELKPRARLSLIRFSKCFRLSFRLVHSRLHESGWTCGVSEGWACFSVECWSKHDRPIIDFSHSKTTFSRLIRQNYWIFQFSNLLKIA